MKQGLQLRLSQHLALTPQLQQSIRLLQLSTLELNAEIDQALQENPLLERDDPGEPPVFALGQTGDAMAHQQQPAASGADEQGESRGGEDEGWGMSFSSGAARPARPQRRRYRQWRNPGRGHLAARTPRRPGRPDPDGRPRACIGRPS
jgi:DNA-directed RNA polymerase specialized sigma54-like protein